MESDLAVVWPEPTTAVLALVGEHDVTNCEALQRQAEEALRSCTLLLIDLSATSFIDSSVIHRLVQVCQHSRSRGVTVQIVVGENPFLRRVLDITGLTGHLDCVQSLPDVLLAAAAIADRPAASSSSSATTLSAAFAPNVH